MTRIYRIICLFIFFLSALSASAQLNDLIIVGFTDWDSGSGVAVSIHNPTASTINLTSYSLSIYNNGSTNHSYTQTLTGNIAPSATIVVGNNGYCNTDCGNCDIQLQTFIGTNQSDAVVLSKNSLTNFIDMINLYGSGVDPVVGFVNSALYKRSILRSPTNCTRYTSTSGNPNLNANTWPSIQFYQTNPNYSVPGWTVTPAPVCLATNFSFNASGQSLSLGPDRSLCPGDSIIITATAGFSSYNWNVAASGPQITVTQPGIYIVTALSACAIARDTVVVTMSPQLTADAGNDNTVCVGDSVELTASSNQSGATYTWSDGATGSNRWVSQPGEYTVAVEQSGFCAARDTVVLEQFPDLHPNLNDQSSQCINRMVYLDSSIYNQALWSTGSTDFSIKADQSGDYSVQVTDTNGCSYLDTFSVDLSVTEHPFKVTEASICPGDSVTFEPDPLELYIYHLSNGTSQKLFLKFKESGVYVVRIFNRFGCELPSQTFTISEKDCSIPPVVIPNVVTPNGDGLNDQFRMEGVEGLTVEFNLYNRWGKEVFSSGNYREEFPGPDVIGGAYYYHVLLSDGREFKGWLTVMK